MKCWNGKANNFLTGLAKTLSNFLKHGAIKIIVRQTPASAYPLLFRIPYWARKFVLCLNSKKQIINSAEAAIFLHR